MNDKEKDPVPAVGQAAVSILLDRFQELAKKGELQALVIGFVKTDGGAAVQSTPMNAIMMNHLCRLIDRRVSREYDRALAQASGARATTGAGAVPENPRQSPAVQLPRNVRRQVEKAQRKLQKRAAAKQPSFEREPIIRRQPS
ncbi:MAG TPA: hypothetical protein VLH80_07290 [Nitrospiraceae bacterium]|nr:hypothetical protein [Nitrospiraceae bacterium]